MASLPRESASAAAMALAWALFVGAWLVLGTLGHSTSPLWFSGLVPVAAWLAIAGGISAFARKGAPSRTAVTAAALLTVVGVACCVRWGSGFAALVAAGGWGVLSCAASRRAGAGRWAEFAPGCALLPGSLVDPMLGPAFGARCTMLPMMAGMAVASDWCAGISVSAGQGVALHLAAMLAPALLLRGLRSPLWIAACMGAGLLALPLLPGVRGWMAMLLLQALAWGIAWSQALHAAPAPVSRRATRDRVSAWLALVPPASVLGLGLAIGAFGLEGLVAVHVALGALSLAGAAGWIVAGTWRHTHSAQKETLS